LEEFSMTIKFNAKAALAAAGLATLGLGVIPSTASAQGPGYDQRYRDSHRQHYSDRARGRYASRHCGSGNGAVGTVAGGAGGALLGNALGGGTAGTIVGGVAGALVGRTLDKKNTRDHNMARNGC
jgi:outer membrane lipoprotein SlyB